METRLARCRKMANKVTNSLFFIGSGLLLGITSLLAFALLTKEKSQKHKRIGDHACPFLTDKKMALAYYDILSSVYDVLNPSFYTLSMREEMVKLIDNDQPMRVLDVGCGTGYTTTGILRLRQVCEAIGIDQNNRQLQKAARKLTPEKPRISLSRGDAENLPFKDETFDAVISVGAVEYFPDPEKALKEMARVVKHDCMVIVGGPEFNWFKKLLLNRVFYTPSTQNFENLFYRAKLQNIRTMLTGVNTFFHTNRYVVVVAGTKN